MQQTCKFCGKKFNHGVSANMIIYCPNCKKLTGSISDYGFGPITPCDIYLGETKIGNISRDYILSSSQYKIHKKLSGEYADLAVYHEAEEIMQAYL